MDKYSDIINLPHHVSKKHKPMPVKDRAAQFAPFAALTGFDEKIEAAADAGAVTFDNVVVGTTYKVTETESGQAGYTTTGEVKNDTVLAETGANVTVTNAKNDTVVTGLIVNNAPFIVMIGVAAAGVAAYGTAKRKLEK